MKFMIDCKPIAKARPRLGKYGTYTPKSTKDYENQVKAAFLKADKKRKYVDAVKMEIDFYFKIPKSYTKKRVKAIEEKKELYTKKPDLDNLAKAIADSLNGLAYVDDSQIVEMVLRKQYSDKECAIVTINKVD